MTPRVSITAPQFGSDPSLLAAASRFADDTELSGLYAFDHLIPLGRPRGPMFDLGSTLGVLATETTSVKIGSMVLRVTARPVSHSIAIARTVAAIAGERTVIGVGLGDALTSDEHRRFGIETPPFAKRVELLEAFCAGLGPGIPVVIGGNHPASARRASSLAGGWNAWDPQPEEFRSTVRELRSDRPGFPVSVGLSVMLGRDRAEAEDLAAGRSLGARVRVWGPDELIGSCLDWFELGADEVILTLVPNRPERWEILADRVLPRLA